VLLVCYINECEAIWGHLEREVAAPTATAGQFASMVSQLASATVPSPRTLSEELLDKLTTNNKQQTTNNKQQTTNNKQTTNHKQQTTSNKQQTNTKPQTTSEHQP